MPTVAPLGILSAMAGQLEMVLLRDDLRALAGQIPKEMRPVIASYLRGGAIVMAWMEGTTDVIGGSFGVSGGSAIMTDGRYFWRFDAADYVERYGIGLPRDFLQHGRDLGWKTPAVTREEIRAIDDYISANYPEISTSSKT